MPALSVLDLAMFLLESRDRHFNVGPLIVVDPPPKQRAKFADRLLARMMKRPVGPPFNYKLHTPLLGVPSLEVDPKIDLSRHVHRITLDSTFKELTAGSKLKSDFDFFQMLRDGGRKAAEHFLKDHFDDIGVRSTIDLAAEAKAEWA